LGAGDPSDQRLADKVAALRAESAPGPAAGPPVREFFARFASRRPWERVSSAAPPSEDDFAAEEPQASVATDMMTDTPTEPSASGEHHAADDTPPPSAPAG